MSVLCLGLLTADVTQQVEAHPRPNQKIAALSTHFDFGGPAANAAATVAGLGNHAALWTVIGQGNLATLVKEMVRATGVVLKNLASPMADASMQVPVSTIFVTKATGDRSVVSSHTLLSGQIDSTQIRDILTASVVLVDGHYLSAAIPVVRQARAAGIPVVLDGGSWKPGLEGLLSSVDVAVLSADFVAPSAHIELLKKCRFVARTNGPEPVELWDRQGNRCSLEVPTVNVVDTLGAGDVLHGAFAHYLARANPVGALDFGTVRDCLERAIRVASRSCEAFGVRGWIGSARSGPWSD